MSELNSPSLAPLLESSAVDGSSRAVLSVLGVNRVGIVAGVATLLAENNVNILDIRQTLMNDLFSMVMVVDFTDATASLPVLKSRLSSLGDELGVQIYLQHEAIFRYMHRVKAEV